MKPTLLAVMIAMIIPTVSMAKVDDFNSMIKESNSAQEQLREDLNQHIKSTRHAQYGVEGEIGDKEDFLQSVNSPTNKGFMTYKKETVHYRASEEKQMERLANEIKSLDAMF